MNQQRRWLKRAMREKQLSQGKTVQNGLPILRAERVAALLTGYERWTAQNAPSTVAPYEPYE